MKGQQRIPAEGWHEVQEMVAPLEGSVLSCRKQVKEEDSWILHTHSVNFEEAPEERGKNLL